MKANAKPVLTSSRDDPRAPRMTNHTAAAYEAMLVTNQNIVIKDSGIRGPGNEIRPRAPRRPTPSRLSNPAITINNRILVSKDTEAAEPSQSGLDGLVGGLS